MAPPAAAPFHGDGCGAPCAPATRTVCVTEYVPQQTVETRTVFRTVCVPETYTACRTECVPETRTRTVMVSRMVPEVRNEVRTVCVSVPTVEQRTVYRRVEVCTPVTTCVTRCVDRGHYECREVPVRPSCWERMRKHRHHDCCEEECVRTRLEKVWVPCMVTEQVPVTRMVRSCQCVPETVNVTVCRMVPRQETFQVTCYRCVSEPRVETCTVMVPRQVSFQATRMVSRCVPTQVQVTVCRMVPRVVERQVPVETCCCEAEPCCNGGKHRRFGHH
jgi:hypothetical protein